MEITLYINESDKNVLTKSLSGGRVLSGSLRDQSDIVSPKILIQDTNPTGYNYMYIPAFGRYYYITEITSVRTGLWLISATVDVLMSYAAQIKRCKGTVTDGKSTGSRYLSGPQWRTTQKKKTDIVTFPAGLKETGEYILITSGG